MASMPSEAGSGTAAALSGLGTRPEWLAERLSNRPVAPRATTAGGR